jgi:L-ribulokinase
LTWDNGDRTVLVNPNLRGITLGWNLQSTAQDELFAAIEGTAFHTRIILDRMAEHGVEMKRVINAGGIPQKNNVLNQIYANVLGRPVLVPSKSVTSLGSAIFAFLAAGTFKTVEEARDEICPEHGCLHPSRRRRKSTTRYTLCITGSISLFGQPGIGKFGDVQPTLSFDILEKSTSCRR